MAAAGRHSKRSKHPASATKAPEKPAAPAAAKPQKRPPASSKSQAKAPAKPAPKPTPKLEVGRLDVDRSFGTTPVADSGVPWSLPEAGLVLVVAFALLVAVQSVVAATATVPWTGVALVGYDVALVALLWYLARRHETNPARAYRIDAWPEPKSVGLALIVALGCWLFSVTYRAVVIAAGITPGGSEGVDLAHLFGGGPASTVLTVLVVAVIGPVLEELLLRGVVLGAVRARLGAWPGIVVSALAFAALHASVWSLLPLAVLGVGLGFLATRSRTLWPAIGAHVLYNGVLVTAALIAAAAR